MTNLQNPAHLAAAKERLDHFCLWVDATSPEKLVNDDGTPSEKLIEFCESTNCSLDWIFRGDLESLFRTGRPSKVTGFNDRLRKFCEANDRAIPHFETDEDGITVMSKEFIDWCAASGACMDWLITGDITLPLQAFSREKKSETEFTRVIENYTDGQRKALMVALRGVVQNRISIEVAMECFQQACRPDQPPIQ